MTALTQKTFFFHFWVSCNAKILKEKTDFIQKRHSLSLLVNIK